MAALRIVALCVLAAVAFGIVHDQVTARVCIEYFTIGHPRLFLSDEPTLHAFAWGILATWWGGLIFGCLLAVAALRGPGPRRSARSLVRPILVLLSCMAVAALLAGALGFALARAGRVALLEPLASRVPAERHIVFLADLWAHNASYLVAFAGGLVLVIGVRHSRRTAEFGRARVAEAVD